jgi:eukaryotic-like serine/threonine-protein kinase
VRDGACNLPCRHSFILGPYITTVRIVASKLARFSWLPGALAASLVIVVGRLIAPDASAGLEATLYDRVLRATSRTTPAELALIDIDQSSLEKLGAWPWPNDLHASLLDKLTASGTKVVGFTVPFQATQSQDDLQRIRDALALLANSNLSEAERARRVRDLPKSAADAAATADPNTQLARAINRHGDVVLPADARLGNYGATSMPPARFFASGTPSQPLAVSASTVQLPADSVLAAASALGHLQLIADADGIVRTDVTALDLGSVLLPSFASAVTARALAVAPEQISFEYGGQLRIGNRSFALDPGLRMRPQYYGTGGAATFTRHSYWQVLSGAVGEAQLRGKIVLIGFADPQNPATPTVATAVDERTPIVMAVAATVDSMVHGHSYTHPGFATAIEWSVIGLVVLLAAFALPVIGLWAGTLVTGMLVAILGVTEVGLLQSTHIWLQLMLPCLAAVAALALHTMAELVRRANVKATGRNGSTDLRALGQTFQQQGQLDLAFETYRRCAPDAQTMELLYHLGVDFERRRQNQKAAAVYGHIATRDPNYRDIRMRQARVKDSPVERDQSAPKTRPLPLPSAPMESSEVDPMSATVPSVKRTLGRYEIERELGKGAMGVVYLGRDPKINRVVAIKAIALAEEFGDEDLVEARARFFREAEMAGRLNHPAIVTVYDAGEDQGLAYIAMEYLRGQHLSHFTDGARLLPADTVMGLVARVADALYYAHRQNVVHRDIKPANIMFNADADELKITDFGIARLTDTSRTKTGIVLGTPSFMSPEQLEGRMLDGRSDQFALGVSLYQLLAGQLPFRAESMPRLMHKIATEPHASIRLLCPELPATVDAVIDRVLAKAAEDRFETCAEFAVALRACMQAGRPQRSEHEWLTP